MRKLKLYLINVHNKIINEIQNDIKRLKNENKERDIVYQKKILNLIIKMNQLFNCPKII